MSHLHVRGLVAGSGLTGVSTQLGNRQFTRTPLRASSAATVGQLYTANEIRIPSLPAVCVMPSAAYFEEPY